MYSRRPLRLRGFDYTEEGLYFVTVCTHERRCFLGRIEGECAILNRLGTIVDRQIVGLPERLAGVGIDMYTVIPNHVHAIVLLGTRARQASPLRVGLGQVVAAFKSGSAREINRIRRTPGARVWQRGYHDHVVRDDADLQRVREYLQTNPIRWALDPENPARSP
jgi:putative transposase